MATTDVGTMKNFIDGEWVDAVRGHRRPSSTRPPARSSPRRRCRRRRTSTARSRAASARVRGLVEHDAGRARAGADPPGRRARGARRRDRRRSRSPTPASRPQAFKGDELPVDGRQPALLRRRARATMEGKAARRVRRGLHVAHPPRGDRRRSAQITPWNYPLMMAIWKIGPALAAGNTIVLKPAETTPLTTLKLGEIAAEFLPKGVLNVIGGRGETGQALVKHPDIRHGLAHRLGGDRQVDRPRRGRHAQARAPRAGRQGAGRRLRRRRHGRGALETIAGTGLLQRRPGLHRSDARAGREQASTTTS